jgi:hypothetical protein
MYFVHPKRRAVRGKSFSKVAVPNDFALENSDPYLSAHNPLSKESTLSEDACESTNPPLLLSRVGTQAGDSKKNPLVKVHPILSQEELE